MALTPRENSLLMIVKLLLIDAYLTKVYTFSHDRLGIPQMDWWGDMCYIIVYKIFEKMYLVLEWTTNYMGKLSLVYFFEIFGQKQQKHTVLMSLFDGEKLKYRRASCIRKR